LGSYAFYQCSSLTSVNFEGNAPSADFTVFYLDYNLTVYYLTSTTGWGQFLSEVGLSGVQWNYTTNNGTITITGYTGSSVAVTIPSEINNLPVTSIGASAFQGYSSLTGVTIPTSVTNIGVEAFDGSGLTSVTIPNSVISIGEGAFAGCASLTAITVNSGNPSYSSVAGVLFNQNQTTLIQYPGAETGSYIIPNSVTTIGAIAFGGCSSLTGVTIPSSVTSIGASAFTFCSSLTSVTIPNSVTSIGSLAFADCASLTVMTVNPINPDYSSVNGVLFNKNQTTLIEFPDDISGNYAIPNSVTNIAAFAFWVCPYLTSVTIPNSVTSIGEDAFIYCTGLSSVTIPSSVTNIGDGAFADCTGLTSVNFEGNAPSADCTVFDGDNNLTVVYYLAGTTGWELTFPCILTVELPNAVLTVSTNGVGSLSTNYNGVSLQVGNSYAITATAGTGFVFTNWTGGTNLPLSVLTNGLTVKFVMEPNLMLQANFVETNKPTLTITGPTSGQHMSNALATVTGTASDNWGVSGVWYQLNNGAWNTSSTTNVWINWNTTVELNSGTNTVKAYAMNLGGIFSATNSVSMVSSNTFLLQLAFTNPVPLTTNGLVLSLKLSTGLNGHIQVSTNLTTWTTLTNFVGTNSTITIRDPGATNSSHRFYQAVIP
jgi:hypothetical protein